MTAHDDIVTVVTSLYILFYHRRTVIRQMMAVEELLTPAAMLTRAIKIWRGGEVTKRRGIALRRYVLFLLKSSYCD
jgi:hypothetical protein